MNLPGKTAPKPVPEQAYLFRHVLVRDAAYQLQLPRQRAELHGLALRCIEKLFANDLPALDLANHARDAQIKGTAAIGKLVETEARYLLQAVKAARASFDLSLAMELAKRLSLLPVATDLLLDANIHLAELHQLAGRTQEALFHADKALALARAGGKPMQEAQTQLVVAHCHRLDAKFAEGTAVALEAFRSPAVASDAKLRSGCLGVLANIAFDTGSMGTALEYLSQSAEIARQVGNESLLAPALMRLGAVYLTLNKLFEAEAYFVEAEAAARRVGDKMTIAGIISNRGLLERRRSNDAAALKNYLDAEALHAELGSLVGLMQNLGNRGTLHRIMGDQESALACYARAQEIALSLGHESSQGMNAANVGMIEFERGNFETALECYARAEGIMRRIGQRQSLVTILYRRAMAQRRMGRLYAALESIIESRLIDAQTTQGTYASHTLHEEAEILVSLGALEIAQDLALKALDFAVKRGFGDEEETPCIALIVLARVALGKGDKPEYERLRTEIDRRMKRIPAAQTAALTSLAFAYSQLPPNAP